MSEQLERAKQSVRMRAENIARKSIGLPISIRYDKSTRYEGIIAEVSIKVMASENSYGCCAQAYFIVRLKTKEGAPIPGVFSVKQLPN